MILQKDSSQETVISLMGMLVGSMVVSHIHSQWATWTALITLLAIHMGTNYLAVRAVSMRTLNRQRANLVFSAYFDDEIKEKKGIPTPEEISIKENVFERDGVLRWNGGKVLGYCEIGVPLQRVLDAFNKANPTAESSKATKTSDFSKLLDVFEYDDYIIYYDDPRKTFLIVLKVSATTITQLYAWMTALWFARWLDEEGPVKVARDFKAASLKIANMMHITPEVLEKRLRDAGWDVEIGALETKSGTRLKKDVDALDEKKAY